MRSCFLALVCAVLLVSCVRRAPEVRYRQLTGTCQGACSYYLACKQARGDDISDHAQEACVVECNEIFSSEDAIKAFERLVCEDAVFFVEGSSGRGPGDPPAPGAAQPATGAPMRSSN